MKTLVLGLGNPILSDDRVGIRVAEIVREHLPEDAPVDVRMVCIGGLRLMEEMIGYERVILIDSYLSRDGVPGTCYRLTLDDLRSHHTTLNSFSPHDVSLAVAYDLGVRMGLSLATEVIVYAVEVENVVDFGEALTPSVEGVVEEIARAVLAEIDPDCVQSKYT